jgi:hypothetical protein
MSRHTSTLDHILAQAKPRIARHWSSCAEAGLSGFTRTATGRVDGLLETYFGRLKALPDPAPTTAIIGEIETLFRELGKVNASCDGRLLETDERELLVPIIIEAASAAGLNTADFQAGDPTFEFRTF